MSSDDNTYDRRVLLGASRRRLEDAEVLYNAERWVGAMYLSGYAIECSLKSLICYEQRLSNLKDTTVFKDQNATKKLHDLHFLLQKLPKHWDIITTRTKIYREAWKTITSYWNTNKLRYNHQQGNQQICKKFLESAKSLHVYLLSQQGETS